METAGLRLDKWLSDAGPDLSRARAKALIQQGCVKVDGAVCLDVREATREGASVSVALPEPEPALPQAQAMTLDIAYEDDDLIVVNKPSGLTVHPGAGQLDGTLVNGLLAHCADSLSGVGGVARPGIVHRLDKETSGLLVVAKHDGAHRGLAEQFAAHGRDGRLERAYAALVWGDPGTKRTIDAPLGRAQHQRTRMTVRGDGREAITHMTRDALLADGLVARVTCELETGRTHQIRVHMTHVGHPLLGDPTYGTGFATKAARLSDDARLALEALGRQALHARVLGFVHPISGERMRFVAEPPADMVRLTNALLSM